ncbi:MAG TPA: hypothetical protein VK606_12135 [Verrucomicrobiae bacterium]|nr:hypothetical protein [Verrucomicrobiae bacterium]
MSFHDTLQGWHDFYVTAGAASATLAGLLFVGLSLHIRIVVTHPEVRSLARFTLSNYFEILLVSLFLLTPTTESRLTGTELVLVAAVTLALMAPISLRGVRERRARTLSLRVLIWRFGLSMLAYLALGAMGILFYAGDGGNALGWLVGTIVVLFLVAIRNTWDLLVTVAEKSPAKQDRE